MNIFLMLIKKPILKYNNHFYLSYFSFHFKRINPPNVNNINVETYKRKLSPNNHLENNLIEHSNNNG